MAVVQLIPEQTSIRGNGVRWYGSSSDFALETGTLLTGTQYVIPNDGEVALLIRPRGYPVNFHFRTPRRVDGLLVENPVVHIPVVDYQFCGPFRPDLYGGALTFAMDEVRTLRLAVVRLP